VRVAQGDFPTHSFEYNTSSFPHRLSYAQDTWGYYNGQTGNSTLVPNGNGLTGAANRSVNTSVAGRWSLEKINWPTGGSTVLNMEADPAGGGLRVASIHDLDGLGNTTGLREYSYQRETFQSPFFLDFYSYYVDDGDPFNPTYHQCNYNQYTASSVQPVSSLDGPDYGYTTVTIDFQADGEQGRTEVEFSGGVSDLSGTSGYAGPLSWGRGEQLSQTHYRYTGSGFAPVQKTENTYTVHLNHTYNMWASPTEPHEQYIYGLDIKLQNPELSNLWGQIMKPARFDVLKYKVISAWYHPDSTYTYLYDPDNASLAVETATKREYDTTTTRLDALVEINSDQSIRRSEYTYGVTGKPSKLSSVAVKDDSGNFLKKRWAVWSDTLGSGRQELKQIWDWNEDSGTPGVSPNTSSDYKIQEIWSYDSDGNPETILDGNGNATNLSWDTSGMYLTEVSRGSGGGALTIQGGYNEFGQLDTLWDENSRIRTFAYDAEHRLHRVRNNAGQLVEQYDYSVTGASFSTSNLNRIELTRYGSASDVRESIQYFDGLGRPVQAQAQEDSNSLVAGITQYDAVGREWRGWKAYPQSGAMSYDASDTTSARNYYDGNPGPDANTRPYVETIYEASPLGRVLRVNPEGVSSTGSGTLRYDYGVSSVDGHNAFWTEIIDEAGKKTRTWTDGWGRTLRSTAGYDTGDAAATNFTYDELDQLKTVTSPEGLQTSYNYDKRGLLTQRVSPDAGTTNYVYDDNGQVRYQQDANLAAATRYLEYTYDFAGRKTLEQTCSGALPTSLSATCSSPQQAIVYTYDDGTVGSGVSFTVNNPLGRLTKVDFQGGYYLYSYDTDGNIERMYNKLDGLSGRTIAYSYNRLGEVIEVEMDGDPHVWEYTYDELGRLDSVKTNTTSSTALDADYSYWPAGMIQAEVLGNGSGSQTISYGYDARDRLLDINNVGSSTPHFSARYTYFANGNINVAQYHQPETGHSDKRYRFTHSYDNRNQLTQADYSKWNGSGWSASTEFDLSSVSYDMDGNITALTRQSEGEKVYAYSYTPDTNLLDDIVKNSTTTIGFTHDDNGNVTTIGSGYDITATAYDWRNLPISMTKSGTTTYNYRYDHAGLRVYKEEGADIHTLRGAFGEALATFRNDTLDYWNILRPDGTVIGRRDSGGRVVLYPGSSGQHTGHY
jgi:YD repeat-containing protein